MIKTIHVEPIKFREKYLSTPLLTKAEVEKAMDYVVAQTRANMEYFGTRFPWSATKGLKYPIIDCIEWTDGFWTGLLWPQHSPWPSPPQPWSAEEWTGTSHGT